jgi:archaellum component FlaC
MIHYEAMRERDKATRLYMEQREVERKAKLTPLELLQEQIEDLMTGYADYGTDFNEIKELFKQYLALEAGETP